MADTWYIFDNIGKLLFFTEDPTRASLDVVPSSFNATYIIKHPHIDLPDNTKITYNVTSQSIELVLVQDPPVVTCTNRDVFDVSVSLTDLLTAIAQLTSELNDTKLELQVVKGMAEETKLVVDTALINV